MKYYIAVDDLKGLNQYAHGVEEVIAGLPMVSASEIIREFLRSAALVESYRCEGFEQACREVLSNMEAKRSMYRQFSLKDSMEKFWDAISKREEVEWSKVAVDTPIFVSDDINNDGWFKRHFAKYEVGMVFAWVDGKTSFTVEYGQTSQWDYAKLAEGKE